LTSIIEKRRSLHRHLANQHQRFSVLESQNLKLQPLANIGSITCMIAHEINNLLTPLANYADLALKNPTDKSLATKALEKTVRTCLHASKVTESMLALGNGQKQEKKDIQLITLVKDVFSGLCRDFVKDGITVEIEIPQDLVIRVVPVQIQQVLMNLILNARDAMLPKGGILKIRSRQDDEAIHIEVADTGSGIESAHLKNIFEAFFTTKVEKSTSSQRYAGGLGLAFCKKIIDAHNGRISVDSQPLKGTVFKINLPKPQSGSS